MTKTHLYSALIVYAVKWGIQDVRANILQDFLEQVTAKRSEV